MTKFTKKNLLDDGMYVHYCPDGFRTLYKDRKFVARFKYMKRNLGPFCTFLRKNFTVEEYFARLDAGDGGRARFVACYLGGCGRAGDLDGAG